MAIRDTSAQDIPQAHAVTLRWQRKRQLWLLLVAAAILSVAAVLVRGWLAGGRSVDAARIRIATVTRGDLVRDIAAEGRVIAANSPSLYAVAAGTVTLQVVAGDVVKAGDLLAELDSPDLRSRLAQEQSTLIGLQSDVRRAQLDATLARSAARKAIDQAQVEQVAAQRELQRYQRGFDGGAVARVEVDKARDNVEKSAIGMSHAQQDANLLAAGAALNASNRAALAERQRAIVDELQRQVDALQIRAPFDGQVGQVFIAPRQNVQANAAILSVVDLSTFEVGIKVAESFARDLAIGMPAQITVQNRTVAAEVSAVSPEVVNGEVAARLRFRVGQQPAELRQNQRLSVRILLDTRKNVLKVERGPALESASSHAWVVTHGIAARRAISTGAASLDSLEIRAGLNVGDNVIVSGAEDFKPDERVRIH